MDERTRTEKHQVTRRRGGDSSPGRRPGPFEARWLAHLALSACLLGFPGMGIAQDQPLPGLSRPADVYFDAHGIPHVFAASWRDAARVLGYLHARDRLWQMELFRRQGSGTAAEILGRGSLESDVVARQLGLRRSCEQLWSAADFPRELREELLAYADGVNARLKELGDAGLPAPFKKLGLKPAPWTPVDSLVFSKYMGWDQSGTDTDLWLGRMAEKLGPAAIEELWPLDRPYEIPAVKTQAERPKTARARARAPADRTRGELFTPLEPVPGAGPVIAAAERRLAGAWWLGRGGISFGSNNWAVDGTKTASGKPILCSDPHLGFQLPSIWYACHVAVEGRSVAGVTFAVSPIVVIGHNDRIGWGLTNLQADAVDYFVETVKPDDPMQYKHRGEWKKMERLTEEIGVRGEASHVLHVDSTVHGPVLSRDEKVGGSEQRAVSIQWTGLGPTRDLVALWRINRAKGLGEFLSALDDLAVPAMNVLYADVEGNIALHPCGALPLRKLGQGRIPMEGASGANDWAGMVPRRELPFALNPPDHFVASANGRPAAAGYPHYLGWMWDPSYRVRRIHEMLAAASKLTVETMAPIQNDALDKTAERFLPFLLGALRPEDLRDNLARLAAGALRAWDRVASPDSIAPAIWLEWFRHYRDLVWDDDWRALGVEKEGGSWGFSGDNRREPMLEVLERLTREDPGSAWFDDRTTPDREDGNRIAIRAFGEAVASLKRRFGGDPTRWAWKHMNKLRIPSLTGEEALGRGGASVPGDTFTVNPGGETGGVSGGASWRMIVDFGDVTRSAGVYPGGQSDDPASPTYDDQIALWATGKYAPLHAVSDAAKLPEAARVRAQRFVP